MEAPPGPIPKHQPSIKNNHPTGNIADSRTLRSIRLGARRMEAHNTVPARNLAAPQHRLYKPDHFPTLSNQFPACKKNCPTQSAHRISAHYLQRHCRQDHQHCRQATFPVRIALFRVLRIALFTTHYKGRDYHPFVNSVHFFHFRQQSLPIPL